jgi:hypothetical protein
MAKVKFGIGVADMRGSTGASTFSRNTYGAYTRQKVTPVNPSTQKQAQVRGTFGGISAAWRGLTEAQRDQFNEYAPQYTRTNVFGDNVPLTGQGLFQKANLNIIKVEGSFIDGITAPVSLSPVTEDGIVVNATTPELTIEGVSSTGADERIGIFATAPYSAGRKFVAKNQFRLIGFIAPSTASGDYDGLSDYETAFGFSVSTMTEGQKIAFELQRVSMKTGQVISSGVRITSVEV